MAIDILFVLLMFAEFERVFSGTRRTIAWLRARLEQPLILQLESLKYWNRSGLIDGYFSLHSDDNDALRFSDSPSPPLSNIRVSISIDWSDIKPSRSIDSHFGNYTFTKAIYSTAKANYSPTCSTIQEYSSAIWKEQEYRKVREYVVFSNTAILWRFVSTIAYFLLETF